MAIRPRFRALGGAASVAVLLFGCYPALSAQELPPDPGFDAAPEPGMMLAAIDPTGEAVRWVDRAAIQVRCAIEQELHDCGCWPPRGVELYALRAVCDFQQQARVVRIAVRNGQLYPAQLRRLATTARDVERLTANITLPCATDLLLQDALDLAVFLGDAT